MVMYNLKGLSRSLFWLASLHLLLAILCCTVDRGVLTRHGSDCSI